jgi:hypothetical protein
LISVDIFSFDGLLVGGFVLLFKNTKESFYLLPIPPSPYIPLVYENLDKLASEETSPFDRFAEERIEEL